MRPTAEIESDLVDLSEVSLADLPALDQQALEPVMGRLLQRVDDPETNVAGYNPQRLD